MGGGALLKLGDITGFGVFLPPPQSVLGKVNEIAKHKAMVQDADTQSKVRPVGPRGHGGGIQRAPPGRAEPPGPC